MSFRVLEKKALNNRGAFKQSNEEKNGERISGNNGQT